MAITKLMHMKESPGWPHTHLKNAIDYILDVKHKGEKTEHGLWVGGNAGIESDEILNHFLETKRAYEKPDGRQGYHFVLSFAKGERSAQTAYTVVQEFCERYLGDNYDYVFAIHNDKEHLHGHVIFNSVSRTDGYKYHYKKGDWKKSIQPVTDEICKEHGLAPLTFLEERVGVSYASWAMEKEGKLNWGTVIQADVDYAVQQADSFVEFSDVMKKMGYGLRMGYSKKHQSSYITYCFTGPDGNKHRRRSYKMPSGYSPEQILTRLKTKGGSKSYEELSALLSEKAVEFLKPGTKAAMKSSRTFGRMYQAVSYYKLPNPYAVPASQVRSDMLRIDRLLEECRYLKKHKVTELRQLKERASRLKEKETELLGQRKMLFGIRETMGPEQAVRMEEYDRLKKELAGPELTEKRREELWDRLAALEAEYPHGMLETQTRLEGLWCELKNVREELRLLERLLSQEDGNTAPVLEQRMKL